MNVSTTCEQNKMGVAVFSVIFYPSEQYSTTALRMTVHMYTVQTMERTYDLSRPRSRHVLQLRGFFLFFLRTSLAPSRCCSTSVFPAPYFVCCAFQHVPFCVLQAKSCRCDAFTRCCSVQKTKIHAPQCGSRCAPCFRGPLFTHNHTAPNLKLPGVSQTQSPRMSVERQPYAPHTKGNTKLTSNRIPKQYNYS